MTSYEYRVNVPELFESDKMFAISVAKIGGGTLGSSYTGTWAVRHWDLKTHKGDVTEIHTGTPKTHEQVAKIYAGFLAAAMEDTEETWTLYDRLSLFAEGE